MDKTISIRQKIDNIKNVLRMHKQLSFKQLLGSSESRTDIIVSFLAILELLKENTVYIKQIRSFEDLIIKKV